MIADRWRRCRRAAWLVVCALGVQARAVTAEHYELTLKPDFAAQRLDGHARVRLRADGAPAGAIELSAAPQLQIVPVLLDGKVVPAQETAAGWRIGMGQAPAGVPLSWLDVDYRAAASDGLVFGADHVYTAFHTCAWMPCAGGELGRASLAIHLDLPAGHRSVTSGPPAAGDAAVRAADGPPAQAYPLYTFGFAAGRLAESVDAGDPRLRYLSAGEPGAALRPLFDESAQVLAFLEGRAGVPLPYPVYTQLLVPGGAAQEASGFSVIGERVLAPLLDDPQEDWVIAHEMAHQWWGNWITCASWNELWLNEGIAVFMTAAWKQHRWGEAAYQRELALARERWQVASAAGFDKPLTWAGEYPSLRIRRAIQYSKAVLFIDALRQQLGEPAFWDGLRRYTRLNGGRSVRSADLQAAMEASAGHGLQPLFARWVSEPAPPGGCSDATAQAACR